MSININDLQIGHTYLIKKYNTLHSVTVLLITGTSFKLRWNNENNPHICWEEKRELDKYIIVEDISDFITSHNVWVDTGCNYDTTLKYKCEFNKCNLCDGTGTIPCDDTTSGVKTCPKCFGSRVTLSDFKLI